MGQPIYQLLHRPAAALICAIAAVVIGLTFSISHSDEYFEPDAFSYRGLVATLTSGHVTLSKSQAQRLDRDLRKLHDNLPRSEGLLQWVQTPHERYASEKNPGYGVILIPFWILGAVKLSTVLFGLLGGSLLWIGVRSWLNAWSATAVVAVVFLAPIALVMSTRPYMPTFVESMLIAAGFGSLLRALTADQAQHWFGASGMFLLSCAVAVRYTNLVLLVAVIAAVLAYRAIGKISWVLAATPVLALCALYNHMVFGSLFSTGYSLPLADTQFVDAGGSTARTTLSASTFSLRAAWDNIHTMPMHLVHALPLASVTLATIVGMLVWWGWNGSTRKDRRASSGIDVAILAVAGTSWLGIWAIYFAYDWVALYSTAHNWAITARFFMPSLVPIALIFGWIIMAARRQLITGCIGLLVIIIGVIGLQLAQLEIVSHAA